MGGQQRRQQPGAVAVGIGQMVVKAVVRPFSPSAITRTPGPSAASSALGQRSS